MNRLKLLLLLVASFSIMFMGLMVLGSYYWLQQAQGVAVLCFLAAFVCALGQIGALAVFLRERAMMQWLRRQTPLSTPTESDHE